VGQCFVVPAYPLVEHGKQMVQFGGIIRVKTGQSRNRFAIQTDLQPTSSGSEPGGQCVLRVCGEPLVGFDRPLIRTGQEQIARIDKGRQRRVSARVLIGILSG
jgi:hypothetical protein